MKKLLILCCVWGLPVMANAGIPLLNYICPGDIDVHADEGGPVFINGREASLKKFSQNGYEAAADGIALSLSFEPGEPISVIYTAKGGAHGVCTPADSTASGGSATGKPPVENPAVNACLAAVAARTSVDRAKLTVIGVVPAAAGTSVTVNVPDAGAPWSCSADDRGEVQGVTYTGTEGRL